MVPNVVGMPQHADGGAMATKPYTSGGAYLNRMTGNHRMARAVQGLDRLSDLEGLVAQEERRGNRAP